MTHSSSIKYNRTILIDILFVVFIYMVPTISHLLRFPLYMLDPMRLSVLGSYLILRSRYNALILAFTLPLVSFLLSGHPIICKNVIIAIELALNVLIIDGLMKTRLNMFSIVFISIIMSKIVYYILKYILISYGLLRTTIIDTNLLIQFGVAILLSILFSKFFIRNDEIVC